jgi:hypothetical protein
MTSARRAKGMIQNKCFFMLRKYFRDSTFPVPKSANPVKPYIR